MLDRLGDPWVVVAPYGAVFLGYAVDETTAWRYALGWPDAKEVEHYKAQGWYAARATVTWEPPGKPFTVSTEGFGTGWKAGPRIVLDETDLFASTPEVDLFK